MATLTQPGDTGALDREAVQQAAREATAPDRTQDSRRRIDPAELDRHAAELRAWLDAHGTIDDRELARRRVIADTATSEPTTATAGFPAGVPAILVHQHLWLPTPPRWEPSRSIDLDVLVDEAFAPVEEAAATFGATDLDTDRDDDLDSDGVFVALPAPPQDERLRGRNRTLGWGLVVGLWAVATALLVPFLIGSVIGSFDLTVDLGDDEIAVEQDAPPADTTEIASS